MAGQGVYIKSGEVSIVDASVIAAKQSRPKQGKDRQNTQDLERKSTDDYKAHDNVDEAGFIKATDYSTGSLHDSNCFTDLLTGEESAAHAEWLPESGIENSSIKRAYRNRPLRKEDKQFNRLHSGARSPVDLHHQTMGYRLSRQVAPKIWRIKENNARNTRNQSKGR